MTAKDIDLQACNFEVMYGLGLRPQFEMAKNLGVYFDLNGLINRSYTVAQFQKTYKLEVQDAIDRLIGE